MTEYHRFIITTCIREPFPLGKGSCFFYRGQRGEPVGKLGFDELTPDQMDAAGRVAKCKECPIDCVGATIRRPRAAKARRQEPPFGRLRLCTPAAAGVAAPTRFSHPHAHRKDRSPRRTAEYAGSLAERRHQSGNANTHRGRRPFGVEVRTCCTCAGRQPKEAQWV